MNHTRQGGIVAFAFLLLLSAGVQPLSAQECALEGNEYTNQAASLIQQGREGEDDEEARMSRYRDALALLEQGMAEHPDNPTALWLAGEVHISLENYAAADSLFERLVEVEPACQGRAEESRRRVWLELHNAGVRTYNAGETAEALEALENATIMYDDPRSYNVAAFIHRNQDEPERAMELYREALEMAGEGEPLRQATVGLVQLLLDAGSVQEAIDTYSPYVTAHPEDVPAVVDYAVVLAIAGQQDSSRAIFSSLMARESKTYDDWYELGLGLMRVEDYAKAIEALEAARELEPYRKDAKPYLVDALIEEERFADAAELADTLVNWYPYDASNYSPLATSLSKLNRSGEALVFLQSAQGLPFEFQSMKLTSEGEVRYVLQGEVMGRPPGAGRTVTIRFEFLGPDGEVVATRELSLEIPSAGAAEAFQLEIESETPIAGYRYQQAEE